MADTLTPNILLTNQTEGGNDNTWGVKCDDNFEQTDNKFGDVTSISTTGGTTVLTDEQEIVNAVKVSGTLVSNATVEFSGRGGTWIIQNATSGSFSVTVKVTGQTGFTVVQGTSTVVWCNGTDLVEGVPTAELVSDTSPQAGGDIDMNGHNIGFDDATGITDDAGNEQVRFQKTASAVNQIDITNAATGGSPSIAATGGDTNIDLTLAGQGTGGVVANFKQGTGLGILDSDSSHALKLTTSSNLTAQRTLTLVPGDADRTVTLSGNLTVSGTATIPAGTALVAANNLSDVSSAATAFGNIKQAATTAATGVLQKADQTAMEALTSGRAVTADVQHFHPGHPKAGGNFDGTGTPAFRSGDYGMGAITDNGTGDYTLAFDTAFANTNYWCAGWGRFDGVGAEGALVSAFNAAAKTASAFRIGVSDTDASHYDSAEIGVTFWGDYA
jgi:hypothetical protein